MKKKNFKLLPRKIWLLKKNLIKFIAKFIENYQFFFNFLKSGWFAHMEAYIFKNGEIFMNYYNWSLDEQISHF